MPKPRYILILNEVKPLEKPVREMRRSELFNRTKQRIFRQDPEYRKRLAKLVRNWNKKNPEKVKEYSRRYGKRPEVKARIAEYNQRPEIKAKHKAWQKKYHKKQYAQPEIRERILAQHRIYEQTPEYKERHKLATKRYYWRHRDDFRLKYILKKSKHI